MVVLVMGVVSEWNPGSHPLPHITLHTEYRPGTGHYPWPWLGTNLCSTVLYNTIILVSTNANCPGQHTVYLSLCNTQETASITVTVLRAGCDAHHQPLL